MHVNDIASVASTLQAAQIRRGDVADLIDPPKPGATLRWPWKMVSVALRLPILAGTALAVRRGRYSITHVHYATQALVGVMARRPFVIHCHGTDIRGVAPSSLRGRVLRAMARRAALLLYATPDLATDAQRLRPDAVFLPNPIDIDAFSPMAGPQRDLLVGVRLDPVKGAETAIEAVDRLLRVRPETTVTVVANGPLLPAARARLGDRVAFVEPRAHAEMPGLLTGHRVALGQFRLGILSQLELEAMACGTPVVTAFHHAAVYDAPPPLEEAADADGVASSVSALLGDERGRLRRAEEGRAWVVAHHGSDIVAGKLDRLYRQALEAGR